MSIEFLQQRPKTSSRGDFLDRLEIRYGPVAMLGRFFLRAEAELRERGLTLWWGSMEELLRTNQSNPDSWRPLVPVFDHRYFPHSPKNCFCIFGRDARGRVVATHAARLFDWSGTTFHEEATSLRLFYSDPEHMKAPGETCEVTAPSARTVTGPTIFSGAAWYHPDYRGCGLSAILPRIGKAYALTKWPADRIVSFMLADVHARGFAPRFGYDTIDWSIIGRNSPLGNHHSAFLSVTRESSLRHIAQLLGDRRPQVDGEVLRRHA
jgi:hypothetical protein